MAEEGADTFGARAEAPKVDRNGRPIAQSDASIADAGIADRAGSFLRSTLIGFERGDTENNARVHFSVQAPDGTAVEGFESYIPQQSTTNFRGSGFSLDTDGDGLSDLEFNSYNGYNTTGISTLNPATGEMDLAGEFKTSANVLLENNRLSDGGALDVTRTMFYLVHAAVENGTTVDEVKALQDFARAGMNSVGIAPPTQSQVFAIGDAFRSEETGKLVEGRGEIAVDFDGNGTKESRVVARLAEDGNTSLIVSNSEQKVVIKDSALAENIISTIADARANGTYSDTEKANLMDLARSALQAAGLGNMVGTMQVAQATLGDTGVQSVGSAQQGQSSAISL